MNAYVLPSLIAATALVTGCAASAHPPAFAAARPTPPLAARATVDPAGDWVMTIRIGERTFEDRFTLARGADGAYAGSLTVVGQWTAPLERIEVRPGRLAFELLAPEGARPFRVRYEGVLDATGRLYTGTATLPEAGEPLGAFSAARAALRAR